MVQSNGNGTLSYELIKEEGPDHDKRFVVQVMKGKEPAGVGSGRTKKAAEQEAAYAVIKKLKKLV